jgi:hypothetical protein
MRDTLQVGSFVRLEGRGNTEFVVLAHDPETLTVREWPITNAPPAFTVNRSSATEVNE